LSCSRMMTGSSTASVLTAGAMATSYWAPGPAARARRRIRAMAACSHGGAAGQHPAMIIGAGSTCRTSGLRALRSARFRWHRAVLRAGWPLCAPVDRGCRRRCASPRADTGRAAAVASGRAHRRGDCAHDRPGRVARPRARPRTATRLHGRPAGHVGLSPSVDRRVAGASGGRGAARARHPGRRRCVHPGHDADRGPAGSSPRSLPPRRGLFLRPR